MIILDTHIWVWWVHRDAHLPPAYRDYIQQHEAEGLGVCAISCWEVAKLVEYGRLLLPLAIDAWLDDALRYPGVRLLDLTPRVAAESTRLPGGFHCDPADQLIVATARLHGCSLVTLDEEIRAYSHVQLGP